jgi:hypothetical protein
MPAIVKYIPFLNAEVEGVNIQKEEITKNIKAIPAITFNQNRG